MCRYTEKDDVWFSVHLQNVNCSPRDLELYLAASCHHLSLKGLEPPYKILVKIY